MNTSASTRTIIRMISCSTLLLLTVYFTITGKVKETGRNFSWVLVGGSYTMDGYGSLCTKAVTYCELWVGHSAECSSHRWSSRKNYINSNQ